MSNAADLTQLATVKQWAGLANVSVSDDLLARLITACSTFIQSWLNRTIRSIGYVETRNGQGSNVMLTQNFPINEVLQVTVDGLTVLPRPALAPTQSVTGSGCGTYVFDDTQIMLTGGYFPRGFQNVLISYTAGYWIEDEVQTIPAIAPYTLTTQGRWSAGDRGVIYLTGSPLTAVTSPPAAGQYSVSGSVYTFNAADAGTQVAISYAMVPADLEQACVDMIKDWFTYKDRTGKLSEGIEGQTITFVNTAIPSRAQGVLNQYKKVAPIQ